MGWIVFQYRGVQEKKIVLQYTFVYCEQKATWMVELYCNTP